MHVPNTKWAASMKSKGKLGGMREHPPGALSTHERDAYSPVYGILATKTQNKEERVSRGTSR
jgi:hypothetical protein